MVEDSERPRTEGTRPRRVLVVENDEGLKSLARGALRKAGFDTEDVSNGTEAIERIMANPDAVLLLDIELPDMHGSELIRALAERNCPVPFVAMSGHGDERAAVEMMRLGASDYLVKGLDLVERLPGAFRRLFREQDTERRLRAAEEALRQSEEHYRADESRRLHSLTLSQIEDRVTVTDLEGFITYVNDAECRMLGKTREQLIGQHVSSYGEDATTGATQEEIIRKTLQDGAWRGEVTNFRADGSAVILDCRTFVVKDDAGQPIALCGISTDITGRKRAEDALRENNALLQALMDNIPDSIYFKDTELRFTRVNKAAAAVLGLSNPDEAVGKDDAHFFTAEHARRVGLQERHTIETGEPLVDFIEEDRLQDGRTRWVSTTQVPILDANGEATGLVGISRDITQRRQDEEALRESEERFRAIFETAVDAIFLKDASHRYTQANPATERYFGVPAAELVAKTSAEVFGEEASARVAEADARVLTGEIVDEEDTRPVDGSLRSFRVIKVPLRDDNGNIIGLAGIARDVTERKRAEKALRESEDYMQAVLESTADGILAVDVRGNIRHANRRFAEMWHVPRELLDAGRDDQLLNHVLEQLTDPEAFVSRVEGLYQSSEEDFDWLGFKDGRLFERFSCPLIRNGILDGRVWSFRDVTDRKRAEEEKLALERQVQHAQKLESLGVLAGGIAHDFNNLLMAILGNADLALDELSPHAPARENIQEIEKASKRAAELAKQMLAYSGKGRFVIEPIALNEFVEEMAHLLDVSTSKKAMLKYNFAENLPLFDGDATQVRQIIMNLITNASEAIGDKSGVIALSTGAMDCDRAYLDNVNETLRASLDEPLPEGAYIYLEVADTGCGMDADTVEKVFDPFFTTKFTGRGLGMSAVLGIVRGHKGAIKIYSEVGKGTTFKVLFPANELPENGSAARRGDEARANEWHGKGTVLIADDEETICAVGRQMLERMGFSVLTAPDGREALKVFREHADDIVCVLLDLSMPHTGGEAAFREMRRLRPNVMVVLCSGYNEQDATQCFAGKGLAGFLQKPYSMAALKETLIRILQTSGNKQDAKAPCRD